MLYYDCSNYYFEIEQEDGSKKYGKSKEHRPNPIIQMGLFMDGDGMPLAFSLFPGNANDPARFIGMYAATQEGEAADIQAYLDDERIESEAQYDGLYAVCTDLLDDDVRDILKVSEGRWQIEECFRIMKTDFSARPIYLQNETRIKAHFLVCFLALLVYRVLEKKLGCKYTCETILETLRNMNFADVQEQGFIPLYKRLPITDALHDACGFRTDFNFITKSQMKTIQKKSKGRQ